MKKTYKNKYNLYVLIDKQRVKVMQSINPRLIWEKRNRLRLQGHEVIIERQPRN